MAVSLLVQSAPPRRIPEAISVTDAITVSRALLPMVGREQRFMRGSGSISIPILLPPYARPTSGMLTLDVAFVGYMLPESNIRVAINGRRRQVLTRRETDAHGRGQVQVPLTAADVANGSISLGLASGVVSGADRCADESSTAGVQLQDGSRILLRFAALTETDRVAAMMFADTVAIRAPALPLVSSTFDSLLFGLTQISFRGQTPVVSWSTPAGLEVREILRLQPPRRHAVVLNPDVRELEHSPLTQEFSRTAEWRFALDERTLPAGRIPERFILKMVAADNATDRLLKVSAYLNSVFLRDVEVLQDGTRRTIRLYFPPGEIQIYNDVTLKAERTTPDRGNCNEAPVTHPAQLQDDGYLHMAVVRPKPERIPELIALLPDTFDLFVAAGTSQNPGYLLNVALQAARGLWGPARWPHTRFYERESAISMDRPSVVLLQGTDSRTTIRVSYAYGAPALVIALARDSAALPVTPESYGGRDTVSFAANGSGTRPTQILPRHIRDPLEFATSRGVWIAVVAIVLTFIALVRQRYDSRLVQT